jgi:hypothetical protein
MSISVACSCGAQLKAPDDAAGKTVACPKCNARVKVPSPARADEPALDSRVRSRRPERDDDDDDAAMRSRPYVNRGKQSGFPLWILALVIPGAVFLIGGVAAVGVIAYRNSAGARQRVEALRQENDTKEQELAQLQKEELQEEQPDMTLAAYLAQRPAAPKKIAAACKLDSYYNFAYGNAARTHYSIRLTEFRPSVAFGHAWVAKDSEAGRKVFEVLRDGQEHRLIVEVALRGPDGTPTPPGQQEMAVVSVNGAQAGQRIGAVAAVAPSRSVAVAPQVPRERKSPAEFTIVQAKFGTGNDWADVTEQVRKMVKNSRLRFVLPREGAALPQLGFPDPAPNRFKQLVVVYSHNGKVQSVTVQTDQEIDLPPVPDERTRVTGDNAATKQATTGASGAPTANASNHQMQMPKENTKDDLPDVALVIPEETRPEVKAIITSQVQALASNKASERANAARVLGELGEQGKPVRRHLCAALLDPSANVRVAAADALKKIDPKLQHLAVRYVMAEASSSTGDKRDRVAFSNLSKLLSEIQSLKNEGEPLTPLIVQSAIRDAGSNTRQLCVEIGTLSRIARNDLSVCKLIGSALDNSDGNVRAASLQALPRMKHGRQYVRKMLKLLGSDPGNTLALIDVLTELAETSNAETIATAISKLRYHQDEGIRRAVETALNKLHNKEKL